MKKLFLSLMFSSLLSINTIAVAFASETCPSIDLIKGEKWDSLGWTLFNNGHVANEEEKKAFSLSASSFKNAVWASNYIYNSACMYYSDNPLAILFKNQPRKPTNASWIWQSFWFASCYVSIEECIFG